MLQMSGGSEFQSWGAERLKTLHPIVLRRAGGTERRIEEDLREREEVAMWRRLDRWGGARLWMALKVW